MDKFFVDKKGKVVKSAGDNERRRHVRFPVNLAVRYYEDVAKPAEDFIHNISMGGVFIKTDTPLSKGARISMDFEIPPKIRYLGRFEGEVVEVNTDAPSYPTGMFVKFLNAEEKQLKMLEEFLEGHRHLLDDDA